MKYTYLDESSDIDYTKIKKKLHVNARRFKCPLCGNKNMLTSQEVSAGLECIDCEERKKQF